MTCYKARRRSTAYVDGRLPASDHSHVSAHLLQCESCASYVEQVRSLRSALKALPQASAPVQLATALRVMASRERQAMDAARGSRLQMMWNRWKFELDMLMRPLTIPATGGLLSSMILFATLAVTIGTNTRVVSYEVPVVYGSKIDANLVPLELRSRSVILTMSLDANGRIRDYMVGDGAASIAGNASLLQYNNIALPAFPSVLALAHPISSDIKISFIPLELRP